MANEIVLQIGAQIINEAFRFSFQPGLLQVDQAAIGRAGHAQLIGIAEEVVDFGDISTNGYLILHNLDDAHYVTYGPTLTGAMVVWGKLKPGEAALMRVAPTVVMRAQANTAPVLLDVYLFED
jgi:hypothetical protein